jgi:hypothetical protein
MKEIIDEIVFIEEFLTCYLLHVCREFASMMGPSKSWSRRSSTTARPMATAGQARHLDQGKSKYMYRGMAYI